MSLRFQDRLENQRLRMILSGFGMGFSWGAAALEIGPIVLPQVEVVQ